MKTRWIIAIALTTTLVGCGGSSDNAKKNNEKKKPKEEETASDDSNPLLAPVNYVGAVGKAKKVSEKKGKKMATKPPEGKERYESCEADCVPLGLAPSSCAVQYLNGLGPHVGPGRPKLLRSPPLPLRSSPSPDV